MAVGVSGNALLVASVFVSEIGSKAVICEPELLEVKQTGVVRIVIYEYKRMKALRKSGILRAY